MDNSFHRGSVAEIVSLFRSSNEVRPILLLGAGASFHSGVPLAADAVVRIVKAHYAKVRLGYDWRLHNRVTTSDWKPYLASLPWFQRYKKNMAEAFPDAVKYLLTPQDFRRAFILDMVQPQRSTSVGYNALADIVYRQLCWTVLTTNFDTLIADCFRSHQPYLRAMVEINKTASDLVAYDDNNRCQIVYLHGAAEYYTDRIAAEETRQLNERLVQNLRGSLRDAPLIVIGYRGAEHSIMKHLLLNGIDDSSHYRHGIWWCIKNNELPHPYVQELATNLGSNFNLVEITGFDELMVQVSQELKSEFHFSMRQETKPDTTSLHEEGILEKKTYSDLDEDLIKTTLAKYCNRLQLSSVHSSQFQSFLLEQRFLTMRDGRCMPTRAAYLLFGKNPADEFPYAKVLLEKEGKKRIVFDGNLLNQLRHLIDYMSTVDVNPILRIKKQKTAEEQQAYPPRAITEILVNMLVHRDYALEEYSRINFVPGKKISFVSPGGLPDAVFQAVNVQEEGNFEPVRNLSQLRNRLIADIFYGIGVMDKAGSGMTDVRDSMLASGGKADYRVHDGNIALTSTLRQAVQQAPEVSNVATPIISREIYTTNHLPFAVIPPTIFLIPFQGERTDIDFVLSERSKELPVCIVDDRSEFKSVWSFADLQLYEQLLPRDLDLRNKIQKPVAELTKNKDQRNRFVWLVGKHWQEYLSTFVREGLFQEPYKKRAYFTLQDRQDSRVVYTSRMNRKVGRNVVKKRTSGRYIYHENEGITYAIENLGDQWSLRIKPFYMFTGKDSITPLPSFKRTKYSTWRIKFDKNKNVDDDLYFWLKFLSRGEPTMNIGGVGVKDLILESSYIETEIAVASGGEEE